LVVNSAILPDANPEQIFPWHLFLAVFGRCNPDQKESDRICKIFGMNKPRTPPLGPAKILNRMIYPQDIAEKELSCRSSVLKDRVKT
jgi:hypothetical protein